MARTVITQHPDGLRLILWQSAEENLGPELSSPDSPELCPVGCGGLTDDPYGGPCGACREAAH